MSAQLDPFTTEIIRNGLIKAAEDMRAAVEWTAYSPVIYEGVDLACGIVDPTPSLIAETAGIPAFLGNLVNAVRDIQDTIGRDRIDPEDIFFCNDPYNGGGTHCNDVVVAYPIFHEGVVVAFAVFKAHVLDIGGIYTGGWYNNTTEVLQEGLLVPPVKLYARGEPNEDIFRILKTNSRLPDALVGDVRSLVGAVRIGGRRVTELIEKYGYETFQASVAEVLDHAERLTRAEIRKIPDGEYEAEFFLDGDGDDDRPLSDKLRVHVVVTVLGDEMTVDLSGSSDQSRGPLNAPRPTSISYVRYGAKAVTTPTLANNEGCFRSLTVKLRPGSMFDPIRPAPTSLWVEASQNIPDLMLKALAPAIPDRVRASTFGSDVATFIYGTDPRTKRYYIMVEESVPGGWGAKPWADGETALHALAEGDTYNIPVEMVEVNYPLRIDRYEIVPDSGGPGQFRGGLGAVKTVTPVDHDCKFIATFDRSKYSPAWGLFGGKEGGPNRLAIVRQDQTVERHVKVTDMPVAAGETIVYEAGGGGGFGDPLTRDPDLVVADVRDGYVSAHSAERDYGVVISEGLNGPEVDEEATTALRGGSPGATDPELLNT
jgi:N-methylhydantoinase B